MDITDLRSEIDAVDSQIAELLTQRMEISRRIAAWKKDAGRPALDTRREREKLNALTAECREDMAQPLRVVYSLLFELSRAEQNKLLAPESEQLRMIRRAIAETPQLFPEEAHVACQGVEGAYSTAACEKLFRAPKITYLKSFEGVFSAIASGLCDYGVLPIENSTAGSVKQVYDLLVRHQCYIVRSTRIKINHALLALPGATVEGIREVYSHEQALSQCQKHLELLPNAALHACSNTAVAAQLVLLRLPPTLIISVRLFMVRTSKPQYVQYVLLGPAPLLGLVILNGLRQRRFVLRHMQPQAAHINSQHSRRFKCGHRLAPHPVQPRRVPAP